MIKIGLISHSPACVGAEKMLLQLAKMLKDSQKYLPILYCPTSAELTDLKDCAMRMDIPVQLIPFSPWYIYVNQNNVGQVANETVKNSHILAKYLRDQSVSLAICNTLTSVMPILAARENNIPIILWVHGILDAHFIAPDFDLERRLLFDRICTALSNKVICCSKWTQNYYQSYIASNKITTISNWVNPPQKMEKFVPNGRFVCLNTFDPNKGVMYLLKACQILRKKKYSFTLDLYGTGSMEKALKDYVCEHDLGNIVSFHGRTNNVDEVYQRSFCVVNPSDIESFGLTLTEAMSHARPVIATASGGPISIVEDKITGFLVPPRDENALAEKMAWLLDHPEDAKKMGQKGELRYKNLFSPERAEKEFLRVIDEVLKAPQSFSSETLLLEDTIRNMLRLEAITAGSTASGLNTTKSSKYYPTYTEQQMCYSGRIRKKRSYAVSCNRKEVSSVSMIFACHDNIQPDGVLNISLWQNGIELTKQSLNLKDIPYDKWFDVHFVTGVDIQQDRYVTIKLAFDYREQSGYFGVYENTDKRNFIYKVFNKLHCPLAGKDALIAYFS